MRERMCMVMRERMCMGPDVRYCPAPNAREFRAGYLTLLTTSVIVFGISFKSAA